MERDHRTAARQAAADLLRSRPVVLDTETTGLDRDSEIVEISVIDADGRVLVDRLVRPSISIPLEARRVHGIDDAMVAGEASWSEVWPVVEEAISGRAIAIYNADFDLAVIHRSHRRHGLVWREPSGPIHCLMRLYAQYHGDWDRRRGAFRWISLDQAARRCGIVLPQRHRAREDAELARAVLISIAGGETPDEP